MSQQTLDMSYLVFAWQDDSPDNAYYVDTKYGTIRLINRNLLDLRDLTDEIEKNHERFYYLPKPDRSELIQDLQEFAGTVADARLKDILSIAFESPHVLSAFKKILERSPEDARRFEEFRNARITARIDKWLKSNAIPTTIDIPEDDEQEYQDDEGDDDW